MNSVSSVPPLIEALTSDSGRTWIRNDFDEVGEQAAERRTLRRHLETIDRPVSERGDLYRSLNKLLETGDNDRFVLYCPLRLVPHVNWYRVYDESVDIFSELFIQSWFRLLHVYDVRANFVDGDVPDIELVEKSLDMRVQAAYLAPALIERGLITLSQINSDDDILHISLNEAMGQPYLHEPNGGLISEKRAKWLKWEEHRQRVKERGLVLGLRIASGDTSGIDDADGETFIAGIASAMENLAAQKKREEALTTFNRYKHHLHHLSEWYDLSGIMSRIFHLGVIGSEELDEFDIFLPNLSGPLHSNLDPVLDLRKTIGAMVTDPELSTIIYPAAIVYGSRLKGYGGRDSDIDVAVFVRPGRKEPVTEILKQKFGFPVVEYWLNEDHSIKDFDQMLPNVGDSISADILLCGAWEGDADTIAMLGNKLLKRYFTEPNKRVRGVWLREMERNLLQYRLLHRGYERYYVTRGPTFLDEGYRTTASKLFASHVFLPTMSGT